MTADHHAHPHVGLGSTSTVLIALAHALNAAVGSPLSDDQLRLLLGYNYVEETAEGEIAFGFETGVGPSVSTYGGMAVMGDELTLVYQHPFAEGCTVFVIIPSSEISSAGAKEFDLLMNRARTLDYQDRELKAYLMLMDLIPALEAGDVRKVGDVVWEIEFRGSKRAEIEHHTFAIYAYMNRLREARVRVRGHVLGRPLDRGHHAALAAGARGGGRPARARGRDRDHGRQHGDPGRLPRRLSCRGRSTSPLSSRTFFSFRITTKTAGPESAGLFRGRDVGRALRPMSSCDEGAG